ncbi:PQQ-dependent sugar dehydrogenase [Siccationidurans soli]|uniref:PQQ-dependent sugar dehydrogenase n=2 Tax=Hymenobacter negativus TaxID=2795026 RepID=A0ABS3QFA0_9BACT|nr:PQQ-dependent sugar dehydrogenase [Hymenobacter negativus]
MNGTPRSSASAERATNNNREQGPAGPKHSFGAQAAKKLAFIAVLLGMMPSRPAQAQLALHAVPVHLTDKKKDFMLQVPKGHELSVAFQGLERPRFFAKSPDGRLFLTDMHNRDDNTQGRVLILDKWSEQEHRFLSIVPFMEHLHNPNQIAFHKANGKTLLYVAETDKLRVFDYVPGSTKQAGEGKVIARFPAYGLSYKYGGWHLTRSLAIHNNKLYVSIGSSCNACLEKEKLRACILEMNLDGSNQRVFATGLRNAVGIQWINNQLWATNMGRDGLGPDEPQDILTSVRENGYYGWPYFYQYRQQMKADKYFVDSVKSTAPRVEKPGLVGFLGHSSPLGLAYFTNYADTVFNKHMLVALHGSNMPGRYRGNEVVMVTGKDKYVPVVTGFLQGKTEALRLGRPCDVMQWDNHSFFISDDKSGVVYYVWKK